MLKKEELDILEELLNEAIVEHLDSGYKITDDYVITIRKMLFKLNLKEYYDYESWVRFEVEE